MIKDIFISGETVVYVLNNTKNTTIYFSLKRRRDDNLFELRKKVYGVDETNEVVLTDTDTWDLMGDYIGEFFIVYETGETVVIQRQISFERRLLDELW